LERYARFVLPALVLAVALMLASCGGAGGSMQNTGGGKGTDSREIKGPKTAGMDHSQMGHGSGGMASGMLMQNGEYSDERFIDAMVPHHQGAIEMAQVALENAEHDEIKQLAENIVSAQQREIEQMKQWREQWYPQG
jgi:uncharacterized protein (DUF305 family)